MKIPKSKRLRLAGIGMAINAVLVIMGMLLGADLIALGTCIAMIDAPIFAYIASDTVRPSN